MGKKYVEMSNIQVTMDAFVAEVIQVIHTNLEKRGMGVEGDPVRRVEQYWSLDGQLLFENDPCKKVNK
jgi:predicted lipid-binding transport protein (Tim44 family)